MVGLLRCDTDHLTSPGHVGYDLKDDKDLLRDKIRIVSTASRMILNTNFPFTNSSYLAEEDSKYKYKLFEDEE